MKKLVATLYNITQWIEMLMHSKEQISGNIVPPVSLQDVLPPHTGWACWPACRKSETGTSPARGSGRRWSPAGPTAAASRSWRRCCGRGPGGRCGHPAHTQEGELPRQSQRDNVITGRSPALSIPATEPTEGFLQGQKSGAAPKFIPSKYY